MNDGFYWGTLLLDIDGEKSGVVFVRDGVGYLYGHAFLTKAYDFGDNPVAIDPPEWLVNNKINERLGC